MSRATCCLLLLGLATPAESYVRSQTEAGAFLEWGRRCVPYHLHEEGGADVSFDQVRAAVEKSFAAWNEVACGDLELRYQGITNEDRVGYRPDWANINVVVFREALDAWEHQAGVIALTTATFCTDPDNTDCPVGRIIDADIELNGAEFDFSTSAVPTLVRFDLRNTLTHEAGHFIGFDHTPVSDATMFASAPEGERKKATLHQDDVDAVCEVYARGRSGPCEPFGVEGDHFVAPVEVESEPGCSAAPGGAIQPWLLLPLVGRRRRRGRSSAPSTWAVLAGRRRRRGVGG